MVNCINHQGLKLWTLYRRPKLPFLFETGRKLIMLPVAILGKFWLEWLNKLKVYNQNTLEKAVYDRDKSTPLITVSNHYSCLDEPLIWVMLKLSVFGNPTKTRWAIGAHDVVFTNYWNSLYFTLGKTVPVIRGEGVYQETIDFIIERLNLGEWTHVFVEGKVNVDRDRLRLKWGVGRMIAECKTSPIVLPIWHCGLDDVLPNVRPYRLHICQKVTYLVGDPMDFTEDVVKLKSLNKSSREIRKHITDKIQEVLFSLREQAEVLHDKHILENRENNVLKKFHR